jgi:acyl carrier protein
LEEEFQIEFTDGEIASLDRVSALVEVLMAKTAGTAG